MKYVVYLTKYVGKLLPPYYVGSTFRKKIESGNYFGSVSSKKWGKIFHEELKNHPDLFSVEILSYHETRKDAINEELNQHILRDVIKSDKYFNESFATPNGFCGRDVSGKNNPFFGKHHSSEFCKKQSESKKGKHTWMKGKSHTEESKKINSEKHKGKPAWNSGKTNVYSLETIEKIKKSQQARRLREKQKTTQNIDI